MTSVPASTAVQQGLLRQAVTLSVIKQNAEADKAIANMIDKAVSGSRGSNVNIRV